MIHRTPVIVGNWKMYKSPAEGAALAHEIVAAVGTLATSDVVVCPPFVTLPSVSDALLGTTIALGAQDIHWEETGAYTGEVSAPMLAGWCTHVIIGHSERRQYFGESDQNVKRKVTGALEYGLVPIICVGENLAENEAGRTAEVVERQVRAAYGDVTSEQAVTTIMAYEPVWAIGTGKAASGAGANAVCGINVRGVLTDLFGENVAQRVRVLYGGSVNPENISVFVNQPDIDGALVGGASIIANDFVLIVENAS